MGSYAASTEDSLGIATVPVTYAAVMLVIGTVAAAIFCFACVLCIRARARFYRRVLQRSDACDAELEAASPHQLPWRKRNPQNGINRPRRSGEAEHVQLPRALTSPGCRHVECEEDCGSTVSFVV